MKSVDPDCEPDLNHLNPVGAVDHSVPVLQVPWATEQLAVIFWYTCRNATLSVNRFAAEYAGYAQQILEQERPGTRSEWLWRRPEWLS